MTRKETPAETLRGYLRQLTPQTRTRLLAEVERLRQTGDDFPGTDIILAELRTEVRRDSGSDSRLDPAAQHFYRILEPYLTSRSEQRTNGGQISRASLPPVWEWIGRDLMATMARAYAGEIKQFVTTGKKHEAELTVQSFQNKAVKYLEGTLASQNGAEQARTRLIARGGTAATLDELRKMLHVLRAREALDKLAQGLPAKIDKLVGGQLDNIWTALDGFAADHGEAVPFALMQVARRLVAPWQLIRLATKATETKDAAEIAATPYAIAVTMVLDRMEDDVETLRGTIKAQHVPRAKELLTHIYDTEYALRVRIDFSNTEWGHRLDATMNALSQLVASEANSFPAGLRHVFRSPGLKSHYSLMGQLTRMGWKCRDVVSGGVAHGRHLVDALRNAQAWSLFQ
jgi:hypothetical protein